MRVIATFCSFLLLFLSQAAGAQSITGFDRVDSVPVFVNGNPLLYPWAGGLNFCQFSEIDLNQDGIQDLFVFDRSGNKITTYLNMGTPNQVDYVLAPQYVSHFPKLHDWALLRDYNCDGKADIFTYSIAGFAVYKNISVGGNLQFQLVTNQVMTDRTPNCNCQNHFIGNLYVSLVDVPAIRDVDGDGDLDILTYGASGTQVEFHRNMSVDKGYGCDSLIFQVGSNCWGQFSESSSSALITLNSPCANPPAAYTINPGDQPLHSGGCLECINTDNDNDQDLLTGNIGIQYLSYLRNDSNNLFAHMDTVDIHYPWYDTHLHLGWFPCAYHVDVNNDGKKDLLFSPNSPNSSENFHSVYYYKNVQSNNNVRVQFVENNFLQDSMIDVGEGAYPVFFDYDNDGDKDLFIGDFGYYDSTGIYPSKIALFRNTGSASHPVFTFITDDFAGINASYHISGNAIAFGDLDGDGDKDMIIGDQFGKLWYFRKDPGPADNFTYVSNNYMNIDVGNFATPQLIDVDRDGVLDLVIGNQSGVLYYYHNNGTPTLPNFSSTATNNFFGSVYVRQIGYSSGYSAPCMYDDNGQYVLLVGSERGWIYRYDNIDGNLTGNFTLTDSMYVSTYEGGNVTPTVADINNDGLRDIAMGNYAGGVSLFFGDNNVSTGQGFVMNNAMFNMYPVPASDEIVVDIPKLIPGKTFFSICDISGKTVLQQEVSSLKNNISISSLAPGLYICTLTDPKGFSSNRQLIICR